MSGFEIAGLQALAQSTYLVIALHLLELLLKQHHPQRRKEHEHSVTGVAKHQREQERKTDDSERS